MFNKKRKQIGIIAVLTVFLSLVLSVLCDIKVTYAADNTSDFNVYAYANRYEDLQPVYKGNLEGYEQHYNQYGIKEGRNGKAYPGNDERNYKLTFVYINRVYYGVDYSAVFDPVYYLSAYADLKNAFGDDQQKAFSHFINNGMREGRRGTADFNVYAYANRYSDLQSVFGGNLTLYYTHYAQYGKRENRNGKNYPGSDIRNSKITFTYISRVSNGIDYSSEFDAVYYLNRYSDLQAAFGNDQQKAFDHFLNFGMQEGRRGNEAFNVFTYANTYVDLLNAFGGDLPSYYSHYISNGAGEGRKAKGDDKNFDVENYITAVNLGDGQYRIGIINPTVSGGEISAVYFPTWSDEDGQDDIIWYSGTKDVRGTWSAVIDGQSHNSVGNYTTHIYAVVNGKQVYMGKKSYINNFNMQIRHGWYERNGKYYFYDRTTGVMQKGGTQAGITLNDDGSAVMTDYAKEKIPVMIRAREIIESICSPTDTLAQKQEKCYQYVAAPPYILKDYPANTYLVGNYWACPDAHYANNILNAYGDQEKIGAECTGESAALGYLYAELNFGDVYLQKEVGNHVWIKVGDRYFDPLFVEAKGREYYNAATYPMSAALSIKIN